VQYYLPISGKPEIGACARTGHEVTMFRKIVTAIIVVPLAVVIIAFAVANRQAVTVSFDPFSSTSPAYATTLPLFVIVFILLILGVLIGGIAAWIRQSKWRRIARKLDADVRALHQELETIRNRFGTSEPAPVEPNPLLVIPPPIP
jgi:uncharacterized integral membrane protein